jgi:hypothetical protein
MPFLMTPAFDGWRPPGSPLADLPRTPFSGPVGDERVSHPARPGGGPAIRSAGRLRPVPVSPRTASARSRPQ